MGSTLFNTTPQNTYPSLIKIGDNLPLSGTLKVLSDGNGNDSVLALSTISLQIGGATGATWDNTNKRLGIGTTTPVGILHLYKAAAATRLAIDGDAGQNRLISYRTGAVQRFGLYVNNTAESGANAGSDFAVRAYNDAGTLLSTPLFIQRSTGNVGIGTTTPAQPLVVSSTFRDYTSAEFSTFLQSTTAQTVGRGGSIGLGGETGGGITSFGAIIGVKENSVFAESGGYLGLMSRANGGPITEKARITSDGYLRMLSGTGGIQFNGDTAAANALDDYEEGDWTMGIAFGNASVGVTYNFRGATYTKIGRQVTLNGYMVLSSKGSSTGAATITGLPFTVGGATGNYTSACLRLSAVSFVGQFQANSDISSTTISFNQISSIGTISNMDDTNFANNSAIMVNMTYFV